MKNNKKSNNSSSGKSIHEYLKNDISDFQVATKTLFECFSSLATSVPLTNQQYLQFLQPSNEPLTPSSIVLQLMNHLIKVDKNYQNSLRKLEKHQKTQKEISDIQKEIEEKDKLISTLALNLKDIESFLENELSQDNVNINNGAVSDNIVNEVLIDTTIPDEASNTTSGNKEVSPEDLISYAHKISGTTSAPFGYQPNIPLASLFKPPAPQDDMMRASVLFTKPPPHVLKYYGFTEVDVVTPNVASPISLGGESATAATSTTTPPNINQQQQTQDQQQTNLESELQPIQSIIAPPPPQQLNIDLDLNPDLDSDEDDEDDEDESENEEIEWD